MAADQQDFVSGFGTASDHEVACRGEGVAREALRCGFIKKALKSTGVGYTTTPGGLARFDSGGLSVPTDQTEALDPAPWMAQELRHFLADPVGEMMLDETERG